MHFELGLLGVWIALALAMISSHFGYSWYIGGVNWGSTIHEAKQKAEERKSFDKGISNVVKTK